MLTLAFLAITLAQPDPLGPGDHTRTLMMGEQKRTYLVHVPKATTRRSRRRSSWPCTGRR